MHIISLSVPSMNTIDKRIPLREFAEVNSQKWATAIIRMRRFELFYYMLTTGERIETPYTLALAAIALSFSLSFFLSFLLTIL
jgi:hypothetical protein